MYELKIRAVGSSSGVVLPRELLAQLGVIEGDRLYATRGADGAFRITPYDEAFKDEMGAAEVVMRQDRDLLRALAKR